MIDTSTLGGTGLPLNLAINNGKTHVSINQSGMKVVDLGSQTVVATIPFTPYPNATPGHTAFGNSHAYIALSNLGSNGQVAVLDLASNLITGYISVGPDPWGAAVHGGKLFVSNNVWWSNGDPATVKVIDLSTETIVNTIPVGINPNNIVISPQSGKAYVTNGNNLSNSVSIIDTKSGSVVSTVQLNKPLVARPSVEVKCTSAHWSSTPTVR